MEAAAPYVASEEDGFSIESNAPVAPVAPVATPAVEAKPAESAPVEGETADEKAARLRDEKGRFAAKATPDDESLRDDEPADAEPKAKEPEPVQKAKPRDNPQARIEQSIARQRQAERERDELRARLEALERPARTQEAPKAAAPASEKFPRFEEWTAKNPDASHDDYLDARDDYNRQRWSRDAAEQQRRHAVTRELEQIAERFTASVDKAGGAEFLASIEARAPHVFVPSMKDLRNGEAPTWRHFLGEEIIRADDPAAVLDYLADHDTEFQALASLPPRGITRRIAQIEKDLSRSAAAPSTGTAPKAPPLSQAKPPVRPVTGSPAVSDDAPDPDSDDFDAHQRFYNRTERRGARGR